MKEYQSLSHTRWDCKYHVVFIPKRRKKRIFGVFAAAVGRDLPRTGRSQGELKIVEGHMMGDHVHMCISIPPKDAVANVVGYLKGKSAIQIVRKFGSRQRNFTARTSERYDQMKLSVYRPARCCGRLCSCPRLCLALPGVFDSLPEGKGTRLAPFPWKAAMAWVKDCAVFRFWTLLR